MVRIFKLLEDAHMSKGKGAWKGEKGMPDYKRENLSVLISEYTTFKNNLSENSKTLIFLLNVHQNVLKRL